jgi:hypothetical protein
MLGVKAMEMMDVKAAISLFKHYVFSLEAKQALLQKVREQAKRDPKLAEHAKTQTESLQTSLRNYLVFSIMFSEQFAKRTGHLLLDPGFGELMAAQDRFVKKTNEVSKFLDTIEKEKSAPKPTSATSSDQADGEKPTCH